MSSAPLTSPLAAELEAATRAWAQGAEREHAGDRRGAAEAYRRAVESHAAFPDAWCSLAALARADGQVPTAIALLRRGLGFSPDSARLHSRLGDLLRVASRLDEATVSLRRAIELDPDSFEAWFNFGLLGAEVGDDGGAMTCYERALALAPADSPLRIAIRWHRAMALLTMGDLAAGFAECEVRSELRPPSFQLPLWRGDAPAGRRLLVWADQGFGDTVQFLRFVPPLAARGAEVILSVQPELAPLLGGFPGVGTLLRIGDPLPAADAHVPLMSLPHRLGTTLATLPPMPALPAPMRPTAPALARPPSTRLMLGIVWAGDPRHPQDRKRSATLEPFLALCDLPGVVVVSLQTGARAADLDTTGARGLVIDGGAALGDFADTAAALSRIDLLVSVDTGIVHLAGALGRPVLVLLPAAADWRWMRERGDSPWYPSLRLFRQTAPGDWDGVLARVRAVIAGKLG
ncbi:MAG: tetratricopeptide repeat-containing glycosyltransferase family protein [Xanthobacteraceae bacterium]